MGHSRLAGFDGRLISGTREYRVCIDTLKQAKSYLDADKMQEVNGFTVDKVVLWPQTARAKRMTIGGDFLLVSKDGISIKRVEDKV